MMEQFTLADMVRSYKEIREIVELELQQERGKEVEDPYQSEQINELITALAKAQGEYQSIGKNRVNPFFKSQYADFDSIMDTIRPILSKNGLALIQVTVIDPTTRSRTLHTKVAHSSGQWIESRQIIIPEKNDDQKFASSVTFNKRHQAMSILNITISDDKYDDDAEENMKETRLNERAGTAINHRYSNDDQEYAPITKDEYDRLAQIVAPWPDMVEEIKNRFKISAISELPRKYYNHVFSQILERIKTRKAGTKPAAN
jgi:hypothetical protein